MSLFGCPGVLPECPFDQSYDTAYANIDPFRLNADEETGPGRGSNAVMTAVNKMIQDEARTKREVLFRRVRESLSQKLIVPSDPVVWRCSEKELGGRRGAGLTAGRECPMYWMEIDVIYTKHERLVFRSRGLVASMAFKREVIPVHNSLTGRLLDGNRLRRYEL